MNQLKVDTLASQKRSWSNAWHWVLMALICLKLFIHLWSANRYGFHRDELLYLTQGNHLAFGYMEVPPVTAWVGRFARLLGGDGLFTIRTLTALTGLAIVLLSLQIVKKLIPKNGPERLFAQVLVVACILTSPALFRNHTLFQPVVFDQLFWLLTYYFLLCYVLNPKPRYLLLIGAMAGLGMMAKYNMLFCGGGIIIAMLFTPHRALILNKWAWVALGLAVLLLLPNLIWQYQHDFPVLDHFKGLYKKQLKGGNAISFLWSQIKMHQYITVPIWLAGLVYFLKDSRLRWLGMVYLATLILFLIAQGQAYYFNGIYPLMFAGGAAMVAQYLEKVTFRRVFKPGIIVTLLFFGMALMPYGTPFLPIEKFVNYTQQIDIKPIKRLPNGRVQNLTGDYADMFGWQEQVKVVADVYQRLTPTEKKQCIIWGENYGEAGALNYLGKSYGLPPAISVHGSFYLWGSGNSRATMAITVGLSKKDMEDLFEEVTLVQMFQHPYAIDEEHNIPILICRKLKAPLHKKWKGWRKYVFS
ncbi:MAG TPA: hypothetical protein DCS93_21480 [Microscillaceae bacterium]|nr:hypothetical protein [Microscillaceae bacterium]